MSKLAKLREQKKNYWKLLEAEECFHYPNDPQQDLENYKSLCRMIEALEGSDETKQGK